MIAQKTSAAARERTVSFGSPGKAAARRTLLSSANTRRQRAIEVNVQRADPITLTLAASRLDLSRGAGEVSS
jgi:hypothetical protein